MLRTMSAVRARIAAILLFGGICLCLAACGSSSAVTPTPQTSVAGSSSAPGQLEALALDALSPAAAELARDLGNDIGIAVYVPSDHRIYQYNAEPQFPAEGAIKLPLMLAVMDRAVRQGKAITDDESDLMRAMITESDNDAATELWNSLGGPSIQAFLERSNISGVTVDSKNWRESGMSCVAGARLMGKLMQGEVLDEGHREYAMRLLSQVEPTADWGVVVAGREAGQAGVMNGWYSKYQGWALASVGYVIPGDGRPAFTIAIFTDRWRYFREGVRKIEEIAGAINNAMLTE
jgi:hypothetical protein